MITALRENWTSTVETWIQNLVKFITNINIELITKKYISDLNKQKDKKEIDI